jgi:hypothetical protein
MARLDPSQNIPKRASESQDWIAWHKSLKRNFGKKTANEIWVYAWAKRGGVDSNANTSRMRDYMSGQGVDIQRTTSDAIFDTATDFTSGLFNVTKWVLIGGGVIVGAFLIKILLSKNTGSQAAVAQTMLRRGR